MFKGGLTQFISAEASGLVYHTAIVNQLRLGSRLYPRVGEYVLDVSGQVLDETYLTVVTVSNENLSRISWRVSINDLNITREFKPQVAIEHKGCTYAVHVFDLSRVVRGGCKYSLTISCDSSQPLLIDGVELIGIRRYSGVTTEINYSSGCVLINPSGSYLTPYTSGFNGIAGISALLNIPSKNAIVDVMVNEKLVKSLSNYLGPTNLYLNVDEPAGKHSLTVCYRNSGEGYNLGAVALYSLLKYKANVRGPKIHPIIREVKDLGREYKILLTLKNEGDLICENALIIALSSGNVVFRDAVKSVKPGAEVDREYVVSKDKISKSIVVRVTYQGLYGQESSEVRSKVALVEA